MLYNKMIIAIVGYVKKPYSGFQLFWQILSLLAISVILGFVLGMIIFDEPFIDVIRSDGFTDTTFFEAYSLSASVLFLILQIRRVYSLLGHLSLAFSVVLSVFLISTAFTYFGASDPYLIYAGFKVLYWLWLLFFPSRKSA